MGYKKIFLLIWFFTTLEASAQTDTSCFCRRICKRNIDNANLLQGRIAYSQLKDYLEKHLYGLESLYPHLYYMDYKTTKNQRETKTNFSLYTYQSLRLQFPDKEGIPLLINSSPANRLSEIKIEFYQNTPLYQGKFTDTPREYFFILAKMGADSSGTILKNMLSLLEGQDKMKTMLTLFERKFYPISTDTIPKDPDALLRKMYGWIESTRQDVNEFVYRECIVPYVHTKEQRKGNSVLISEAPLQENPKVIERFNILFQKQLGKISLEKYNKLVHQYYQLYLISPEMAYLFPETLLHRWDSKKKESYAENLYSWALIYPDTLKFDAEKGILNNKKVRACFPHSEIAGTGMVLSFDEILPFFREKKYLQTIDSLYPSISDSLLKNFSGVQVPEATIMYYRKGNEICSFHGTGIVITSKYIGGTMAIKGKTSGDWFYPASGKKISLEKLQQELKEKFYRITLEELSGELRIRFIKIA